MAAGMCRQRSGHGLQALLVFWDFYSKYIRGLMLATKAVDLAVESAFGLSSSPCRTPAYADKGPIRNPETRDGTSVSTQSRVRRHCRIEHRAIFRRKFVAPGCQLRRHTQGPHRALQTLSIELQNSRKFLRSLLAISTSAYFFLCTVLGIHRILSSFPILKMDKMGWVGVEGRAGRRL